MSRLRAGAVLLAGVASLAGWAAVSVAAAPAASAHATVVSSSPADGARLATAPAAVSITFDEPVRLGPGSYLQVVDTTGRRVDAGPAAVSGAVLTVRLRGAGDGGFVASFRVVSADSHPVTGVIRFVVGSGTAPAAPTPAGGHGVPAVFDVVRAVDYLGLAVLGGGWLLVVGWDPSRQLRPVRRLLWGGGFAVLLATIGETLLQGLSVSGRGFGHIADPDLLHAALGSPYGDAHSVRLICLVGIAVTLDRLFAAPRRPVWLPAVAAAAAAGVALSYAAAGHAAAAHPRWLAMAADAAHVLAMAGWLGGVVLLVTLLRPAYDDPDAARLLHRFSAVAPVLIAVLVTSGVYQAWRESAGWHALLATRYGALVLVKAAVLLAVVAVASRSRRLLGRGDATGRLFRAVVAELALAVVAIGAAAVLVAEPPGRAVAAAASAARPVSASVAIGHGSAATVTVRPRRHGAVTVTVTVRGRVPRGLALTALQPEQHLGPLPVALRDGRAAGVSLPAAGAWRFRITATWSEFDATVADVVLRLK